MAPKSIVLLGAQILAATQREGIAAEGSNIKPGMLLERGTDGEVQPHSSAGGNTPKYIADMPDYVGGGKDYAYQNEEQVKYQAGIPGTQFYMWLSAGEDAAEGDTLESAGDGYLNVTPGTDAGERLFVALEDVDNSGGSDAVRIIVEVL